MPESSGSIRPGSADRTTRLGLDGATQALRTSLQLPPNLPIAAWLRIGTQITVIANSSAWWAGDWLIHGSSAYPDRYRQAIARTSLDYQTLRNYAWVARSFEVARRREDLSFQHHQEVAALPPEEQDLWLDRAAEAGWSKTELRRRLRRSRDGSDATTTSLTRLHVELEAGRLESWRRAASREDVDVAHWLVRIADRAAGATDPTECESVG